MSESGVKRTTDVEEAATALREGRLVAMPTETVYGLAALARDPRAVRSVFEAKGRPLRHPLIVHHASMEAARPWARLWPPAAVTLAERFWPGPLTLVLPRSALAGDDVTGGQDTVALRVPRHPLARALLEAVGDGLVAPSANRFGRVSPTRTEHVEEELGSRVDLILDGGPCAVGLESTIVAVTADDVVTLLRPGGISRELLEETLGRPLGRRPLRVQEVDEATQCAAADDVPSPSSEPPPRAPGMLASHYAPRARVELFESDAALLSRARSLIDAGQTVGLLAPAALLDSAPAAARGLPAPPTVEAQARAFYATLREADALGCEALLIRLPPEEGLGLALRDRMCRAAAPRRRGDLG